MYRHIPRKRYVTIGTPSGPPPPPPVGVISFSNTNPILSVQEDGSGVVLIKVIHVSGGPFTSFALGAPVYTGATSGWATASFVFIGGERHVRIDVNANGMDEADTESMTLDVTVGNASPSVTTLTLTLDVQNDPTNDGVLQLSPSGVTAFTATQGSTNYPSAVLTLSSTGEEKPQGPILSGINYQGGPNGWLNVGPVQTNPDGTYSIPVAVNDLTIATGTWTATCDVTDVHVGGSATIQVQLTVNAASVPITIAVSPPSLSFSGTFGGADPQPQVFTITRSGTGTITAPTISEPSALSWLTESVASGTDPQWDVVVTPDITGLAVGVHTGTVRVSHASATNSPVDVSVTFTVAAAPSGNFAAPPWTPPVGMPWNATTNRFDNHPLQTRYVDNQIAAPDWIDIDTTAHPTSGLVSTSLTDTSSANFNMTLLNNWISYHNSQGVRKGYESASGRVYRGQLTTPHNSAAGWSGLRTKGVTYDSTKTSVTRRVAADGGMVLMAGTNDQPVFRTSVSGAADDHHGRWALIGLQITADPVTCGLSQSLPFHQGLVNFGSAQSSQNTTAKMPRGFLMHDCVVRGVVGQYFRRGMWIEGLDMEIRASLVDEIHNSTNYGADNGITQDAQCVCAMNGASRVWIAYSILHGGDECYNSGGGSAVIPDSELTDWFFDHVEFAATEFYCFATANTVPPGGPYDKTTPHASGSGYAFWQKKNPFEMKRGHRFLLQFCRFTGTRAPNNNQGYAITIKTGPYGLLTPLQGSKDVMIHGCWIERVPGMLGIKARDPEGTPGTTGVLANRISMTDTFGWKVGETPYWQNKSRVLARNDSNGQSYGFDAADIYIDHITEASTQTQAGWTFWSGADNSSTRLVYKNSINSFGFSTGFQSNGASGTKFGSAMLTAVSGGTHDSSHVLFVPTAANITAYPANFWKEASLATVFTDYANKDLSLVPGSQYASGGARQAADGHNVGVRDPALVMAEIALVPTILTAADYTPAFG